MEQRGESQRRKKRKKGKRNEKEVGRTQGTENISTSCLGNRCPKAQPQIGGRWSHLHVPDEPYVRKAQFHSELFYAL